ncbi:manganese transport protein [Pseudomonas sp. URIL14HWK12:I9]|nr:manganese transport protein [Pseudomonas sp. URIL14HWK12:I12]PVZ24225.1 manganese transport protein [Pseudomonas sp. URIL14HWK12:I10]PVZ33136.1 manganese transport protein [Pseudomonas sp. URIL14HWK12:I11]SNZ10490.1 manganese transport protein [Pseudomonas sp. URIL14HWK12:I9]
MWRRCSETTRALFHPEHFFVAKPNPQRQADGGEPALLSRHAGGTSRASLGELNASVRLPAGAGWLRRLLAFTGPGYMVAVGYMDPGNWATDLAGGSRLGYLLLSVILLSSLMAVVLQALSARLGIATGLDLAQACRERCPMPVNIFLWLACEIAIIACDLAEVIGTAIALKLLFGIELLWGAVLCALDVFLILLLMRKGFRALEAFVASLLGLIFLCFVVQMALTHPPIAQVLAGFIPRAQVITDPTALYLAIGILGATVMPHNLYLHSSIVQTRAYPRTDAGRREGLRWAVTDSTLALTLALFVNAAILITAAGVFHAGGHTEVESIEQAHELLSPMLGVGIASVLFAVALLASGVNSTVTATLAGQIVMEGFLHLRLPHWLRRLITRCLAVIPVVVITAIYGERGTTELLVFSQVVLSMQLPLAVIPLVWFVGDRRLMGPLVVGPATKVLAWAIAAVIVGLNTWLLLGTLQGWGT